MVKALSFHCKGVWVTSLVGEPRSHLLLETKRKVLSLRTEGIVSEKPKLVGQSLLSTPRRMGVLGALEDIASP